ncbi:MAG TPA: hypothetical protein VJN18_21855 [Polyangiaceae bacterium]|nr:hypothetical protein [Polyangiaceae bacterium]
MKPGDHPDFFRLPPPAGRSRESTIVLTRDGRFLHDGEPVQHPGMQRAFASWLGRHPDDGRYILNNGYDWSYLTVEGALCFVQTVRDVQGKPVLLLLDGTELPLDPDALRCDAEGQLLLELPEGEPARFTAAAQLQLSPWLSERAGRIGVLISGEFWSIQGAGSS